MKFSPLYIVMMICWLFAASCGKPADYDPDAGIASLTLTIPSWVSAINRAMRESDWSHVTTQAKAQLVGALDKLLAAVQDTVATVRENENGRL